MGEALKSYALDMNLSDQDNKTNIDNVKFDVYFDSNNKTDKEIEKDINSEDLTLFVEVDVQNGGYLSNGQIELANCNFELKDKFDEDKLKLDTVQSSVTLELPITAIKDELFDLSLLDMVSQIKLSGKYIKNSEETQLDSTKNVKISWTAENITEENSPIKLNQEVVTNKVHNIEGINKRVIQILVSSGIENNQYPIKSTEIELNVPALGEEYPEKVIVASCGTVATNGKDSTEFENVQGVEGEEETKLGNWTYNKDDQKVNITVNNKESDNKVSWSKGGDDKFVVTYVYAENVDTTNFESNVSSKVSLYETNNTVLTKTSKITKENMEELETDIALNISGTDVIYKGNMYISEDTNYQTQINTFVSYTDLAKRIVIEDLGDVADITNLATYYKSTRINKAKALDVLGQDGVINIYAVENTETPLAVIELSEENEEDYITVNYGGNISKIIIETTEAVKEGNIEIINDKLIKVLNIEEIELATKIDSKVRVIMTDSKNNIHANLEKVATSNLVEPTTKIDVSLNKNVISNQVENALTLTTILKASNNTNKLFNNPTINIELPKEITEVSIDNIALVYEDELKIKSSDVITNENGNKVIVVKLEGQQTKYNTNSVQGGANIVMDLKVLANPFMADKNVDIKATCINSAENAEDKEIIKIESKKGLVTKNNLTVGTKANEQVNNNNLKATIAEDTTVSMSSKIINNFGESISNINIVGNIPNGTTLANAIVSSTEGIEILYSEDSTNWEKEVADYSKVKSFKLVLKEMVVAGLIDLKYDLNVKLDAIDSTSLDSNLKVNFLINGQPKEDKIVFTLNTATQNVEEEEQQEQNVEQQVDITSTEKLNVQVVSTAGGELVTNGSEINNGQVLRYKVKVANTSNEVINNLRVKITKQNGIFYDLVQCGIVFDESKDENGNLIYPEGKPVYTYDEVKDVEYKEFTLEKLEPGQSNEFEYQIVSYIGNGDNANQFNNNILITADNIEDIKLVDTKIIEEAKIALKLKYGLNEEVKSYSDSTVMFRIEATNLLDQELENVNAKMLLPEELDCNIENQSFIEDNGNIILSRNGNEINILFKKLNSKDTQTATVEFITKELPINKLKEDITLNLIGTIEGDKKEYLSNDYTRTILQRKTHLTVNLTSNKINEVLEDGNEIIYIASIKNDGYVNSELLISDFMQKELNVTDVKIIRNNGEEESVDYNVIQNEDFNCVNISEKLAPQNSITVIIKAKINLEDSRETNIVNKVSITAGENHIFETEELVNEIINENGIYEENDKVDNDLDIGGMENGESNKDDLENNPGTEVPGENEDLENNPETEMPGENEDLEKDPELEVPEKNEDSENNTDIKEPNDNEKKNYSISGVAWLDENKNGIRDSEEKTLKMLEVILLDSKGNQIAKTITSLAGMYKFENLDKGEYMVVFNYDIERYAIAKYQVEIAEETNNSDAIFKVIELNNEMKTVGITDTIKINNKDIGNIDIGLVENPEFDLSLNKYISKVVVTNKKGTTTYTYDKTELAKVEIGAKDISGTVLLIEYEIEVSNDGDVNGYVTDVIDYLPKELEFNSEMNTEWYFGKDNCLHCMSLNPQAIEPGKTQTVKLTLTKTLKLDSTGTIENIAEISESGNIEAIKDNDSIAGNKKAGEDDLGKASLIVSISTGSPIMYIGIVLIAMLVLGSGIYIINKKILRERI